MPKSNPFPSGQIVVADQDLLDMSAGMNWDMRDASSVRFLAVRGTIWVGDCQTTYNFTLVEYQLYIDEVPWLIFSTLADVLERKSLNPAFGIPLTTIGKSGGVFWNHPGMDKPTVLRHRIPKFDYPSLIMSLIPCVSCNLLCGTIPTWKFTPNGAAIFHEQKKLAFLLRKM